MKLPTYDEILLMSTKECFAAIKSLDTAYDFKKPIKVYTEEIDRVVNTLLAIEDRLEIVNPTTQTGEPKKALTSALRENHHIRTPKGVFKGLQGAMDGMGYTRNTIISYLTAKSDQYWWVEDHPGRPTGFEDLDK